MVGFMHDENLPKPKHPAGCFFYVESNLMEKYELTRLGLSEPLFLCPDADVSRVYLDVSKGTVVSVEACYENVSLLSRKAEREVWYPLPYGRISGDFALEETGLHALRFRVGVTEKDIKPHVEVVIEYINYERETLCLKQAS